MDFGKIVSGLAAMGYKRAAARAKIAHDVVLAANGRMSVAECYVVGRDPELNARTPSGARRTWWMGWSGNVRRIPPTASSR